jgi:hypothetical protein
LTERFRQGIGGQFIRPAFEYDDALTGKADDCAGEQVRHSVGSEVIHCVGRDIKCRSRLGGLLNFYYPEAA